jgi:hypothetical protein
MSDHMDDVAKPRISERFQRWWFKGMIPNEESGELSPAIWSHLEGMAHHALDIQRAAERAGLRIRRDALASGSRVAGRLEGLEAKLSALEGELAAVLASVRGELETLRQDLGHEAGVAGTVRGPAAPSLSPAPGSQPANGGATSFAL